MGARACAPSQARLPEQCALSSAVGSDDAHDGSRRQVERQVAEEQALAAAEANKELTALRGLRGLR
eukprot:5795029-Pleurochrysis_carterae.AAC.1